MGGESNNLWDVLVIGGGPAGMFAAAAARLRGAGVALLEKNPRLGRKMSITGGGRCNLTNTVPPDEFIKNIPGNGKFVLGALSRFSPLDCMRFFGELGVPARAEEEGRVFPAGGSADQVVAALEKHLASLGVAVFYSCRAKGLLLEKGRCRGVTASGGRLFHAGAVVVATGGASYPRTGSTGDGYDLAREAGHSVVPLLPGLAPVCLADPGIGRSLQGLSVRDATLTLVDPGGKKTVSQRGDIVFTHFGLSGPAALKLSRAVAGQAAAGRGGPRLLLDILPGIKEDALAGKFLSLAGEQPRKSALNLLKALIPERLAVLAAGMLSLDGGKKAGEAGKDTWRGAARLIKRLPLDTAGTRPLAEAMVTVGGISTREIDPRTMASRLAEGLYFAGEVMDVDAYTGGFNMQVAFSTGWLAGLSAAGKAGFGEV